MANFEDLTICSLDEYQEAVETCVVKDDLRQGELYTLYGKVDSRKIDATKMAVRLALVENNIVTVEMLDEDLVPIVQAKACVVYSGLMYKLNVGVVDHESEATYRIPEACLKHYADDEYGNFLSLSQSLDVSV